MNTKSKKDKKLDKKEQKKKLKNIKTESDINEKKETQKDDILSKLDRLDDISIAQSRMTEEKLRKGLIDSQTPSKSTVLKRNYFSISELKEQIEGLRQLKLKHFDNGELTKSIEIAKKIINKAKIHNMKEIIAEEEDFIHQIQQQVTPMKSSKYQIEELKKKRQVYYVEEKFDEAIQIAKLIIEIAREENLTDIVNSEENFIKIMEEKIAKINSVTSQNAITKELGIVNRKAFNADSLNDQQEIQEMNEIKIDLNRIKEEKIKFEEEKASFNQEKINFEEQKKNFEQEKLKFAEEKEAFEWEKKMFEEAKRFETEKYSDKNIL